MPCALHAISNTCCVTCSGYNTFVSHAQDVMLVLRVQGVVLIFCYTENDIALRM